MGWAGGGAPVLPSLAQPEMCARAHSDTPTHTTAPAPAPPAPAPAPPQLHFGEQKT